MLNPGSQAKAEAALPFLLPLDATSTFRPLLVSRASTSLIIFGNLCFGSLVARLVHQPMTCRVSESAMRNQVLTSVLSLCIAAAGEAQAQAVFNTPDGPVTVRPYLGRAHGIPAPERAPSAISVPAHAPLGAPAASGNYGGGFIEMLMTGRDPGPGIRPMPPGPYYGQPGLAALPVSPGHQGYGIRRVVPSQFHRQIVDYEGRQGPGTIIIDTPNKFLYLVQEGGKAIRYGIGVGRPGFAWAGLKTVTSKREWPDWRPPAEMLRRRPDLPRHMAGGPDNPMGARALYLGSSLYRIHGTNEPWTIGEAVSSGCIRMMNEDVVDLYNRTRVGTKVLVI
jgi:lipoprotein-anchoring transpeptidase ErfK/SrfK